MPQKQVHELDTYSGQLTSGAVFAVDDGNDQNRVSYTQIRDAVEESRNYIVVMQDDDYQNMTRHDPDVCYYTIGGDDPDPPTVEGFRVTANGYAKYLIKGTDVAIDFGDGTVVPAQTYTGSSFETHQYSDGNDHIVTFGGTITEIKFGAELEPDNEGLTAVLDKIPDTVTNVQWMFAGCPNMTTVPGNVFSDLTGITSFDHTFDGSGITAIPNGIFSSANAATSFVSCFADCQINNIPETLFSAATSATVMDGCFAGTSIQEIPSGLLASTTSITSVANMFNGCSGVTSIPSSLFAYTTHIVTFRGCFAGTSITVVPESLFAAATSATDFSFCFCDCTALGSRAVGDNTFMYNTMATTFESCFEGCINLINPSLWGKVFQHNTNVTSFKRCYANSGIQNAYSSALFVNCTNATDFTEVFAGCTSLRYIYPELFAQNTRATTFKGAFQGCTSLISVPEAMFDSNQTVTTFDYCFDGCTSVSNTHTNLPELWERSGVSGTHCYRGITVALNIEDVPTAWK